MTDDLFVETLKARLTALMQAKGIKSAPLARAAGLNESAVRDILRGRSKNPGICTLRDIARVLEVDVSALWETPEQTAVNVTHTLGSTQTNYDVKIVGHARCAVDTLQDQFSK